MLACSHPLVIVGDSDILSASGTRDCYLEDFGTGADSGSKNRDVEAYQEIYYAVPREGWDFTACKHYCNDGADLYSMRI